MRRGWPGEGDWFIMAAMGKRSIVPDEIETYVSGLMPGETLIARSLREETAALPRGSMQIGPDEAAFMAMLVRVLSVRRALEIGTFTGYSALAVASALPDEGRLVCCDVSEEWTDIARRYWREAGVAEKIDLRLGPAMETLTAMLKDGAAETFDFAFIDADKMNYDPYYEACLRLVRPGGVIALDNMLWKGKVVNAAAEDEETKALHALNLKIRDDERVDACLLTIGDGVMLAQKRDR
jgi:predicted O-methyltransferase YrrM